MPGNHTHIGACMGVYPSFNFHANCLSSKNGKISRYTVCKVHLKLKLHAIMTFTFSCDQFKPRVHLVYLLDLCENHCQQRHAYMYTFPIRRDGCCKITITMKPSWTNNLSSVTIRGGLTCITNQNMRLYSSILRAYRKTSTRTEEFAINYKWEPGNLVTFLTKILDMKVHDIVMVSFMSHCNF